MKRKWLKTIVLAVFLTWGAEAVLAQTPAIGRRWTHVATTMPAEWYGSEESVAIAENVLLYQHPTGGWPKNIAMQQPISDDVRVVLEGDRKGYDPTFDNDATTTEMRFLAKMFTATNDSRYSEAFQKALECILEAQYENGGWPQYYPLRPGYYNRITYNDDAIVNNMEILRAIATRNGEFPFAESENNVIRCRQAFDKGIECMLATQIVVEGEPTVWCAQHDEYTLAPAHARAYELPSFSGGESVGVILMLMDLPDPSPEVIRSIEGAVKWIESKKIHGIRVEQFLPNGERDRHVVQDPEAPAIWARFYDLETQEPFFCGRDGIKRKNLADIEYERRNGYGYYTYEPQKVLDRYPEWKTQLK